MNKYGIENQGEYYILPDGRKVKNDAREAGAFIVPYIQLKLMKDAQKEMEKRKAQKYFVDQLDKY